MDHHPYEFHGLADSSTQVQKLISRAKGTKEVIDKILEMEMVAKGSR